MIREENLEITESFDNNDEEMETDICSSSSQVDQMSGKRKRKSETTISAAHEAKKPTCQEIDLSVDNETKIKTRRMEDGRIEDSGYSDTIKFANCTSCKGKIGSPTGDRCRCTLLVHRGSK
jgi:hypothetical protein